MEIADYPDPIFIGLRRKVRLAAPPDWCNHSRAKQVVEICSVSNCIVGGPLIWYDGFEEAVHWTLEESIASWTSMDAARQAELIKLAILSEHECYTDDQLCLCAYRIFPLMFTQSASPSVLESKQLFLAEYALPLPEPDWTTFERLGYDVAQFKPIRLLDLEGVSPAENNMTNGSYGCSPLSCNMLSDLYPVNRYCLLDDLDRAFQVGLKFGHEEPEPGPFVIMEVLRRRA